MAPLIKVRPGNKLQAVKGSKIYQNTFIINAQGITVFGFNRVFVDKSHWPHCKKSILDSTSSDDFITGLVWYLNVHCTKILIKF